MPRILVEIVPDTATAPPDLVGIRQTITIPDGAPIRPSFHQFLGWLTFHPEIAAQIISPLEHLFHPLPQLPKPQ